MQPDTFVQIHKTHAEKHLSCLAQDGIEIRLIDNAYCLFVDGFNWMNTNSIDILDHKRILEFEGRVLCTGLGLGVCVAYAALNPNIAHVDVIENDPRIISIIKPMLEKAFPEFSFRIIQADADTFDAHGYDCAFLDHYPAAIPDEIKQKYCTQIPEVVCWYDEALKWSKQC